ncbi:MAG: SEC-C domain-containing protein [Aggregatilineales bacterium]
MHIKTLANHRATSVLLPTNINEPCYILLLLPLLEADYEIYREVRRGFLHACCMVAKLKYPNLSDFIGIATETVVTEFSSEDLLYYDGRDWTDEERQEAITLQNDLGLLVNLTEYKTTEYEYPLLPRYGRNDKGKRKTHKYPRNSPCYCGSGIKHKYCCMRK